jgi:hypothetical protein
MPVVAAGHDPVSGVANRRRKVAGCNSPVGDFAPAIQA